MKEAMPLMMFQQQQQPGVGLQVLSSPRGCDGCPMKPECSPANKPCMPVSGSMDFGAKDLVSRAPVTRESNLIMAADRFKTPKEVTVTTASESGSSVSAGGGGSEFWLTCNTCGNRYSSNSSCSHQAKAA